MQIVESGSSHVVWSLDPETRMWPSGCQDRLQTIVSWASSMLPSSFSLLIHASHTCRTRHTIQHSTRNIYSAPTTSEKYTVSHSKCQLIFKASENSRCLKAALEVVL